MTIYIYETRYVLAPFKGYITEVAIMDEAKALMLTLGWSYRLDTVRQAMDLLEDCEVYVFANELMIGD